MLSGKPWHEWVHQYELGHLHPVNKTMHIIGIPMIAVSIPLFVIVPFIPDFWPIPVTMFAVGWVLQFAGHWIEGKPPEFFHDWRFLFVGLRWWLEKISGRT